MNANAEHERCSACGGEKDAEGWCSRYCEDLSGPVDAGVPEIAVQSPDRVQRMIRRAVVEAMRSSCAKSKRGVVIFDDLFRVYACGHNDQPPGMRCNGSAACRSSCPQLCQHAERAAMDALLMLRIPPGERRDPRGGLHMLHVKAIDGAAVPSGSPSCWQCSREILSLAEPVGLLDVWLLHENGIRSYSPIDFHRATLRSCELPILEAP